MKDVTSTSFGLAIAFLLPGLTFTYALSFFSPRMQAVFESFLTVEANVGLFLLVVLAAVAASLEISLLRWLLFEQLLCRKGRLLPADFARLGEEGKLPAFRAAVDEHYRYHQFWGGMSLSLPLLFFGWANEQALWVNLGTAWPLFSAAVLVEGITIAGAIEAYRNYVRRAKSILK